MKHATRMVLIPEVDYLKHKLSSSKKQSSRKAAIELTQRLGKQIRQRNQSTARLKAEWNPLKTQSPSVQLSSLYKDTTSSASPLHLVEHLPLVYQNKAKLLLEQLTSKGMRWNEKNNLVLASGDTIPDSNMVDLMKEALVNTGRRGRAKPKPPGWDEFIIQVATTGVPHSLFTKQATLRDLGDARTMYEAY